MAKPHERVFALVTALLFLASSIAVSALVVWQINEQKKTDEISQAVNKAQEEQQQKEQNCTIGQADGTKEKVPAVFKPSGDVTKLETKDLEVGSGQEIKSGDCLIVKYHGTLAKDGKKFDGNFDTDKSLKFLFDKGQVIKGWDQGLAGMKVGGTRRIVIPSDLGYGEQATGSIPANADLVFVVKLVKIEQ
jgi:peptidylprolyl isomerase